MEARYGLNCDNCGNYFTSIEAFPLPHLCPRCLIVYKAGRESMLKEVKEWVIRNNLIPRHKGGCYGVIQPDPDCPNCKWQAFLKEKK
jgi:DNA-directed RNA polymerase subunit RPC12/RpoP